MMMSAWGKGMRAVSPFSAEIFKYVSVNMSECQNVRMAECQNVRLAECQDGSFRTDVIFFDYYDSTKFSLFLSDC